jgi:hypothetical protein
MTKANAYVESIKTLAKAKEYNAANRKKIQKLQLLASDARVLDALSDNNVEATRFNARALYATEKCVKIVYEATRDTVSIADLNENAFAAIKCAILASEAKEHMTKADIESAILADCKISDARKHLVYERATKISAVAQVQQCIDMLHTLNIVKTVARNTYEVAESKLFDTFKTQFSQVAI